jgi:hypothetical protein
VHQVDPKDSEISAFLLLRERVWYKFCVRQRRVTDGNYFLSLNSWYLFIKTRMRQVKTGKIGLHVFLIDPSKYSKFIQLPENYKTSSRLFPWAKSDVKPCTTKHKSFILVFRFACKISIFLHNKKYEKNMKLCCV